MTTKAKREKTAGPKKPVAALEPVFDELVALLKKHAPPFRTDIACMAGSKKSFQLTVPKPVIVPGAYGGKPVDLQFAALILQKDYVGFYLMPLYGNPELKKKLSPALVELLKGKTCFHIKTLDDTLRDDISAALKSGAQAYRSKGWLG